MNKYQEALQRVKNCACSGCECESIHLLDELVERATSKKLKIDQELVNLTMYGRCPNCGQHIIVSKYCRIAFCIKCGQALDL